MQNGIEKLKKLKELYSYKSFGYNYYQDKLKSDLALCKFIPDDINLLNKTLLDCQLCQFSKTRKRVVLGEGNVNSKIMFISEAPNNNEDAAGKPFVGKSGELFNKIINSMLNLTRDDVYITNILKCKPSSALQTNDQEVNLCKPFMLKQIDIVNPSIIVTLGKLSFSYLTNDYESSFENIRGEVIQFGKSKLIPTLHPSHLLKNPSLKKDVYKDMLKIKGFL